MDVINDSGSDVTMSTLFVAYPKSPLLVEV